MNREASWAAALKKIMIVGLFSILTGTTVHASGWVPVGGFAQVGTGDELTTSYALGVLWESTWQRQYSFGKVGLGSDFIVSRWRTEIDPNHNRWVTQVGFTPTLRWRPLTPSSWFVDIGVGLNLITPRFRADEKHFSTDFNFGDHLGVGYQLPTHRRQEVILRVEHFSNGGISTPNPGENFLQLRYSLFL